MSSRQYRKSNQHFMEGAINLLTDTIQAILVTSAYTPDFETHDTTADIPGGAIVATQTLTAKTTNVPKPGVFDADGGTTMFSGVSSGKVVVGAVIVKQGSYLLWYIDGKAYLHAGCAATGTTISVEPIPAGLLTGAAVIGPSGSTTLAQPANAGSRSISLAGSLTVAAGDVITVENSDSGFPLTTDGTVITVNWSRGSFRIGALGY